MFCKYKPELRQYQTNMKPVYYFLSLYGHIPTQFELKNPTWTAYLRQMNTIRYNIYIIKCRKYSKVNPIA